MTAALPATPWVRALKAAWAARVEIATCLYVVANLIWMHLWRGWETLPFHFIYFGVAIVYGIRSWPLAGSLWAITAVAVSTGILTLHAGSRGTEAWAELAEVPMMSLLFLAMVFHVERRRRAMELNRRLADERAERLRSERQFFSRASHELSTPITIARGHLEMLGRAGEPTAAELQATRAIVIDELDRVEGLLGELLLSARLASGSEERERIHGWPGTSRRAGSGFRSAAGRCGSTPAVTSRAPRRRSVAPSRA